MECPREPKGAPKDSQNDRKPHKKAQNHTLKSTPGKVDEQVPTWDHPNLKI